MSLKNKKRILFLSIVVIVIASIIFFLSSKEIHAPENIQIIDLDNSTQTTENTNVTKEALLADLYSKYKDGSIAECMYDGEVVYRASVNAESSGATIYNSNVVAIGWVSGIDGKPDKTAQNTKDCKDVYVPKDNVWGKNEINIYNLK